MRYQIKSYETATGKCPFDDWMNKLNDKKAKIAVDLRLERVKLGN
jgi:putative component of toxin-antitoxin plasmid stabilization module